MGELGRLVSHDTVLSVLAALTAGCLQASQLNAYAGTEVATLPAGLAASNLSPASLLIDWAEEEAPPSDLPPVVYTWVVPDALADAEDDFLSPVIRACSRWWQLELIPSEDVPGTLGFFLSAIGDAAGAGGGGGADVSDEFEPVKVDFALELLKQGQVGRVVPRLAPCKRRPGPRAARSSPPLRPILLVLRSFLTALASDVPRPPTFLTALASDALPCLAGGQAGRRQVRRQHRRVQ